LKHPYDLYDVVHRAICRSLQHRLGLNLQLRGATRRSPAEPLLCYLREDEHDVCLGGVKVMGSAQRRRRGALLQHGSLLLNASPITPGVRGLYDLAPAARGLLDSPGEWQIDLARAIASDVSIG
jgi:lipoate-protein ligase A